MSACASDWVSGQICLIYRQTFVSCMPFCFTVTAVSHRKFANKSQIKVRIRRKKCKNTMQNCIQKEVFFSSPNAILWKLREFWSTQFLFKFVIESGKLELKSPVTSIMHFGLNSSFSLSQLHKWLYYGHNVMDYQIKIHHYCSLQ